MITPKMNADEMQCMKCERVTVKRNDGSNECNYCAPRSLAELGEAIDVLAAAAPETSESVAALEANDSDGTEYVQVMRLREELDLALAVVEAARAVQSWAPDDDVRDALVAFDAKRGGT